MKNIYLGKAIKEAIQLAPTRGGSISKDSDGCLAIFQFALIVRDFNLYADLNGKPQRVAIEPYNTTEELKELLTAYAVENDCVKYGYFVPLVGLISITCKFNDLDSDTWTKVEAKALNTAERDGLICLQDWEPWTV